MYSGAEVSSCMESNSSTVILRNSFHVNPSDCFTDMSEDGGGFSVFEGGGS